MNGETASIDSSSHLYSSVVAQVHQRTVRPVNKGRRCGHDTVARASSLAHRSAGVAAWAINVAICERAEGSVLPAADGRLDGY